MSLIRRWVQRYGPELEQRLRLGNTGLEPLLGSCTRGLRPTLGSARVTLGHLHRSCNTRSALPITPKLPEEN